MALATRVLRMSQRIWSHIRYNCRCGTQKQRRHRNPLWPGELADDSNRDHPKRATSTTMDTLFADDHCQRPTSGLVLRMAFGNRLDVLAKLEPIAHEDTHRNSRKAQIERDHLERLCQPSRICTECRPRRDKGAQQSLRMTSCILIPIEQYAS